MQPPGPPPPPPPPGPGYGYTPTPIGAFPRNMQPPPPPPPPPPPRSFGQRYAQEFGGIVARQAHFGYMNLGGAARGALTAAAPEVAIPLEVAQAGLNTAKDAVKALKEFVDKTLDANKALAGFSPLIGTEFARLQLSDYNRTRGLAKATEQPAAAMIRAVDEMRKALYPFTVAQSNAANLGAAAGAGFFKGAADEARILPDLFEWIRTNLDPKNSATVQIAEMLGHAVVNYLIPGLGYLKMIAEWFGMKKIDDPGLAPDAWAMRIRAEAGNPWGAPFNGPPVRFNPAERRP